MPIAFDACMAGTLGTEYGYFMGDGASLEWMMTELWCIYGFRYAMWRASIIQWN